jgi:23S rRNA A1618 N6-methylase RlmF
LGNPAIGNIFNMDGIILLNEKFDITSLTPDLYASKIDAVKDNLNRVQNLENADDTLWRLINESRNIQR